MAYQRAENNAISVQEKNTNVWEIDSPIKPKRNKYAFGSALLASLASVLLGYYFGAMSGAVLFIKTTLKVSDVKISIVLGVFNFCSLIGSIAGGRMCDWIGRRYTIAFAGVMFFAGAVLMSCATGYGFLTVGNLAASIGVGFAFMIAPVYTAEISPASFRGFLSTFPEVFMNVGLLLGYILAYSFSKLPDYLGWRLMLGAGAVPSVFLIVGILAMPESPRWLVMQGRINEAKIVLDRTSDSKEEAQIRLADIIEAANLEEQQGDENDDVLGVVNVKGKRPISTGGAAGPWKELFYRPSPSICHVVIAAVGINLLRQASGLDVTLLYGPLIFEKAGIASDQKLLATIALGAVKLVFVLVATFLLDKVGRRPLLLISAMGMIVSLVGLGIGLTIINHTDEKVVWAVGLCVTTILTNTAFFSIGLGPITWVYTSEIFPMRLRGVGSSIAVAVNRVTSGIIVLTFTLLCNVITIGGTFFLYAGFALLSWAFFYAMLPETKGKTLEEMQELFGDFVIWRRSSSSNSKSKQNKLQKQVENQT